MNNRSTPKDHFDRAEKLNAENKLVEALEEYISAHHAGYPNALRCAKIAIKNSTLEALLKYHKDQLLDIVTKLAKCSPTDHAIELYQYCLSKDTALGQRFRKQGPINKSGFARGTIKTLYDRLQERIASKPNIKILQEQSNRQLELTIKQLPNSYDRIDTTTTNLLIEEIKKAIQINPLNAKAHFELGLLYFLLDLTDLALPLFNTSVLIAPNVSAFYAIRADTYYFLGNNKLALDDINEAINLRKDFETPSADSNYHQARGEIYLAQQEFDKAMVDFNDAIKLSAQQNRHRYLRSRGVCYSAMGNIKAAVKDYLHAAKSYTESGDLLSQENPIYQSLKNVLANLNSEQLDRLSKNDILKMLTDITPLLTPTDAYDLCNLPFELNTALGIRLRKEEKIAGIFADSSSESIKKLREHYKEKMRSSNHRLGNHH